MWQWTCVSLLQKYSMLAWSRFGIAAHSPVHLSPGTSPGALPRCKWVTSAAELHIPTYHGTLPGSLMQHTQVFIMERVGRCRA